MFKASCRVGSHLLATQIFGASGVLALGAVRVQHQRGVRRAVKAGANLAAALGIIAPAISTFHV